MSEYAGPLTQIGMAAAVMAQSPPYCEYPIVCIPLWIEPAIRHQQIHFFLDALGNVCGYVTWAWLAEDAEYRFIHDPEVLLHISEWNEGDRLWLIDFLVLDGSAKTRIRETMALFDGSGVAKSLRRREDGTVRKITTWQRR